MHIVYYVCVMESKLTATLVQCSASHVFRSIFYQIPFKIPYHHDNPIYLARPFHIKMLYYYKLSELAVHFDIPSFSRENYLAILQHL